jgi:uncharacterized cupin superfamily protein
MPKKKAPGTADARACTTPSPEGYLEPFNVDAVPWEKLRGSTSFKTLGCYGGGSQVGVGIDVMKPGHHLFNHTEENCVFMAIGANKPDDSACFPNSGKATIRAIGKTVPITEV